MTVHPTKQKVSSSIAENIRAVQPLKSAADKSGSSVLIVVPCYNEAERLDGVNFIRALREDERLHFVFVNDGSTDATQNILEQIQACCPARIELLKLEKNSGKAEAVRQGLLFAAERKVDLVGYWDADLATPLSAIKDFTEIAFRYSEVDVVYGSRIQLLGHRISRTLARRAVSRTCSLLARMAVRLPVRDTQCGAKLLRNTPALRSCLEKEFTAGWLFDVELFSRLSTRISNRHKAFYEFPLAEWTEIAGSKVTGKVILKSGFRMLRLVVESRLKRAPSSTLMLSTTNHDSNLAA